MHDSASKDRSTRFYRWQCPMELARAHGEHNASRGERFLAQIKKNNTNLSMGGGPSLPPSDHVDANGVGHDPLGRWVLRVNRVEG